LSLLLSPPSLALSLSLSPSLSLAVCLSPGNKFTDLKTIAFLSEHSLQISHVSFSLSLSRSLSPPALFVSLTLFPPRLTPPFSVTLFSPASLTLLLSLPRSPSLSPPPPPPPPPPLPSSRSLRSPP